MFSIVPSSPTSGYRTLKPAGLLHGEHASTPTVAALYGARLRNIDIEDALQDVLTALPHANPNPVFRDALRRLGTFIAAPCE